MSDNFSKQYNNLLEVYKHLHENGTNLENAANTFDGKSLEFFFKPIKQVIENTKSSSLIDFGCGKGKFYSNQVIIDNNKYRNITKYWQINDYYLYDPGVEKYNIYPSEKKDGVICIDVIEHINPEDIKLFIENLFKLANKFVFAIIACYPANKLLPDGRNVHLSIKKSEEWKSIFKEIIKKFPDISPFIICANDRNIFESIS